MTPFVRIAICVVGLTTITFAADQDRRWPAWRGSSTSGSTVVGQYPNQLGESSALKWKLKLPGNACSTPIVWDDHIFVTTPIDGQDGIISVDWEGKVQWTKTFGAHRKGKHRNGSGANPSPVTDGKFIFAYYKSGRLVGMGMDGSERWQTNLQEQFAKDTLFWDLGTSPVLTEKHVVVAVMHKGESFLIAYDKATGKQAWRVLRNYPCPVEVDHSYATPIVIEHDGREAILVWGAAHVTVHDASNGQTIWDCGDFNPSNKSYWVAVSSSVIVGDVCVVPYGRGQTLTGVKLGGKGDVTKSHKIWERTDSAGSFVPTPAGYKGHVYVLDDRGSVSCVDPKTGQTVWKDKFPRTRSNYYSSPTIAGGKLYAAREDGVIFVAQIDGGFKVLSENDMGERTIASPVPVDSHLLIRGSEHLFCYQGK